MAEEKVRFQLRISPETDRKIQTVMPHSNCQSKNEFIENALKLYCEFLSSGDCSEVLPTILVSSFRGTIQDSENRIARLLFKLAVEMDILMNVMAAGMDVDEATIKNLRGRCVQNVKKTGGSISFEDALRFQKGLE